VKGSDPKCDEAIRMMDRINAFLQQEVEQKIPYVTTVDELVQLAG